MKILVFAPIGRDAELLCALLHTHQLGCSSVLDAHACVHYLVEGCDTLFITEEVIRDVAGFDLVLAELAKEPEWSDLPVIALVSLSAVRQLGPHYEQKLQGINLTFIERPARSEVIIQALSSALRARRRQYQIRDFLAEKLKEQENLWRTQKLESIGVLAGGIAHDFNNLLTGILGSASLLQEVSDSEHRMLAELIVKAAERAANLTRQMLAYSGKGRFVVEHVNLTHLIRETLDLIKAAIDKQVSVSLFLDDPLQPVDADAGQMQQVVMNLIINASEAMEGEVGTITISAKEVEVDHNFAKSFPAQEVHPGRYIRVEVQDTGCGMSEEILSKIFDPFFTTKFTGRGLGLAAVSGILRGHKGALQVSSQPGKGTTFKVFLPVTQSNTEVSSVVLSAKKQKGWGTVLLVDDEPVVRRTGQLALERLVVCVRQNADYRV